MGFFISFVENDEIKTFNELPNNSRMTRGEKST